MKYATLLCLLLTLVIGQTIAQQSQKTIDLKLSLDSIPAEKRGKVYLKIAKRYLENDVNQDSFLLYSSKVKELAMKQSDEALLFDYFYFMGVRKYRETSFEEALTYFDSAALQTVSLVDTPQVIKLYYSRGVVNRYLHKASQFQENMFKALDLAKASSNYNLTVQILVALSLESFHKGLLDEQMALLLQAKPYYEEASIKGQLNFLTNLSHAHLEQYQVKKKVKDLEEAKRITNQALKIAEEEELKVNIANLLVKRLFIYELEEQTPQRFYQLADTISQLGRSMKDPFFIFKGEVNKAKALALQGKPRRVLSMKRELFDLVKVLDEWSYDREVNQLMYEASKEVGQYKEAIAFNERFLISHDSLTSIEKAKSYAEILEKYENEVKEKEIQKLSYQSEKLELAAVAQERKTQNLLLFIGVLVSLGGLLAFYFYFRQQQRISKLRVQTANQQQQLLRSQMNPHFLFNSLNSIKRFYIEGRIEEANDFLADFSTLLRQILEQSSKSDVHIEEEVAFLDLYLQLEQRRLKKKLDYTITFDKSEFDFDDQIPSLILQPLVENSIWHGIMNAEGNGQINISVTKENGQIHCIVKDNGIGYQAVPVKKKTGYVSRGLQLIKDRLQGKGTLQISSIKDQIGNIAGTKAEVVLLVN